MTDCLKDPAAFLGPEGPIAQSLASYEARPQQMALAQAVDHAFTEPHHLIAEAGTGTGKSFAYLVPAIKVALDQNIKVVISTYTIALQEQLVYKDIPFLRKVMDIEFTPVLAKGRSNYFCWRRFRQAQRRGMTLFDSIDSAQALEEIYHWALETQDGSLSDLPFRPPHEVWENICSESGTCPGKRCDQHSMCFYQKARRKLYNADLIIVNHALLFSDLAAKLENGQILPRFQRAIIDEAHNIENVAGSHFGLRLSNAQITYQLNRIYNPRTKRGNLAHHYSPQLERLIHAVSQVADEFFAEVVRYYDEQLAAGQNARVQRTDLFHTDLNVGLNELGKFLQGLALASMEEQEKMEITHIAERCFALADDVGHFLDQQFANHVYWVEVSRRRYRPLIAACSAPLHVGQTLQQALWDQCPCVLTSATLSTQEHAEAASDGGFGFLAERVGLDDYESIQVESPFDYAQQVEAYVEAGLPQPVQQADAFVPAAARAIEKYLRMTHGKAFILFTSFKLLDQMADQLRDFCREHDIMILQQGKGVNRAQLLDEFRQNTNSVLFGTESFWQGVDVPGEALSNVIIVKLPFAVPDHPLLQARLERIRQKGGNAFFDYQLPEAVLKFRQGIGRLIRAKTDRGIIVVLDPRVLTKSYGQYFLRALPNCPVHTIQPDQVPRPQRK